MSEELKVLVGVPTAGFSKDDHFYDYIEMIKCPSNTIRTYARGQSPARNRNDIILQAFENEATHVLFIDDDTRPLPDILYRLLAHDKDIVSALYLMRQFPHQGIIFSETDKDGRCLHKWLDNNTKPELIEIVACGLGAVLIKVEVFKKMKELDLEIQKYNTWVRLGELEKDSWCDDIGFFQRVREAGFRIYCDLSTLVGHTTTCVVYPNYDFKTGKWSTSYDTGGFMRVNHPQMFPVEREDGKLELSFR